MWGHIVTTLVIWALKSAHINNQERQLLTAALLTHLGALPLRARIVVDDAGQIFVDGKQLTLGAAQQLRDGSKALMKNFARKVVREQVIFMALHKGVHENTSPEQGLFAKAALWFFQEEEELYRKFAQEDVGEDHESHTL